MKIFEEENKKPCFKAEVEIIKRFSPLATLQQNNAVAVI